MAFRNTRSKVFMIANNQGLTIGDGLARPGNWNVLAAAYPYLFNGASYDRQRGSALNVGAILAEIVGTISGTVDVTDRAARLVGVVDTELAAAVAAGDALANQTTAPVVSLEQVWNGAAWERARTPNVFKIIANVAFVAGTLQTVWTPAAGKKFRLMGFVIGASVDSVIRFCDNVTGTEIYRTGLQQAARTSVPMGNGLLSAVANNVLKIDVLTNSTLNGTVWGTEE